MWCALQKTSATVQICETQAKILFTLYNHNVHNDLFEYEFTGNLHVSYIQNSYASLEKALFLQQTIDNRERRRIFGGTADPRVIFSLKLKSGFMWQPRDETQSWWSIHLPIEEKRRSSPHLTKVASRYERSDSVIHTWTIVMGQRRTPCSILQKTAAL